MAARRRVAAGLLAVALVTAWPASGAALDQVAEAMQDLVVLYTTPPESLGPIAARLQSAEADVRSTVLQHNADADPLLEADAATNLALLLRLRTLEALTAACHRDLDGVRHATHAESLEAALRATLEELRPDASAALTLGAGVRVGRAERRTALAALGRAVAEVGTAAGPGGAAAFLVLHAVAADDRAHLGAARARETGWERDYARALAALADGRRTLFVADDPARRLVLALRALAGGGVLPAASLPQPAALEPGPALRPNRFATGLAELDRLARLVDESATRATPIQGSRRDYYRQVGALAPAVDAEAEAGARRLARTALADLRARWTDAALRQAGIDVVCEIDPVEIVPGQPALVSWSIAAPRGASLAGAVGRLGGRPVRIEPPAVDLAPGAHVTLHCDAVRLATAAPGVRLVVPAALRLGLAGWGAIDVLDHPSIRVVAPVQASLGPVADPLLDGGVKSLEAVVTSRSPHPIRGMLRVLATNDWKVRPSRTFGFDLRRPGQTARARIDLELPPLSRPGVYEVALRLDIGDQTVGTLRTQLVRPVQWVVVGPFAVPPTRGELAPERGASLGAQYPGPDGEPRTWRSVPRDAYDPDGRLDLEALYPEAADGGCACALTVVESPEAGSAVLVTNAARVAWNGAPPGADGRVRVERGRNVLVARSCAGPDGWTLDVLLRDPAGEPLQVLANDLARLLDGYTDLRQAEVRASPASSIDRLVVLRFDASRAAQEVAVLGAFSAWTPRELVRQADGAWQCELRLQPGRYAYKLLVDGKLRPDPGAAATEPDGFGGRNSLLIVR